MSLSPSRQIDMVKQVLGIRGVGEGQRNCFTSTLPRASLEVDSREQQMGVSSTGG